MRRKKKKLTENRPDTGTSSLGFFQVNVGAPIEFILTGPRPTIQFGLAQRPEGKRRWWVSDVDGNEHLINKFQINYQFPGDFRVEKVKSFYNKVLTTENKLLETFAVEQFWQAALSKFNSEVLINADDASTLLFEMGKIPESGGIYSFICHRIMSANEKYFKKLSIHGYHVRNREDVQRYIEEIERREKEEKDLRHFVMTIQKILDLQEKGEEEKADEVFFLEADIKYLNALKDFSIDENNADIIIADRILTPLGIGTNPHNAFDLLKKIKIFGTYENPWILAWRNDPLDVGEDEVEFFQKTALQRPIYDDVMHMRKHFPLPVFTIADASGLHRIGWSFGKVEGEDWVFIHVTDPSRYLAPNSDLDEIFRKRGLSVVLPEVQFAMFPELLQDQISLKIDPNNKKQKKLAMTIGIKPERDGRVIDYKLIYSVLDAEKVYNLSIDEANAIILGHEEAMTPNSSHVREKFFQEWISIEQFAERRRKFRIRHGAIALKIPKSTVKIAREKFIPGAAHVFRIDLTPDNELNNAVGVVSEMELVVGEIAASFCSKMNVPMIYKSQPPIPLDLDFKPSNDPLEDRIKQESLDKLYKKDRSDESVISMITRRNNFPPEVYSVTPKKHNGLALTSYGQIANPLNDYYDLANHYQLKYAVILSEWKRSKVDDDEDSPMPPNPFNHNVIHDIVALSESRKIDIQNLQKNSTRFWIYWSMKNDLEDNVFTQYSALVVVARDDRNETTVLVRHYELEAKMTTKRKYTKGERIFLRVEHVDPFYDRLVLKEAKGKPT